MASRLARVKNNALEEETVLNPTTTKAFTICTKRGVSIENRIPASLEQHTGRARYVYEVPVGARRKFGRLARNSVPPDTVYITQRL